MPIGAFDFNGLVDQAPNFIATQRRDHAFDLTPMTKASDIALVAAALGASCSLKARIVAEAIHQFSRIGKGEPAMNEGRVHETPSNRAAVSVVPTNVVNAALTIFTRGGHGLGMRNTTRAGGCFLTLCILAGFPLGLAIGNPMKGILIGTGAGIVIAVAMWLIDSRKPR